MIFFILNYLIFNRNKREKRKIKRQEKNKKLTQNAIKSEIKQEMLDQIDNNLFKDNRVNLKFYLYAPPEFDINEKCSFGIIHELGQWKPENIIKLNAKYLRINRI